jgi:hypothetical protein
MSAFIPGLIIGFNLGVLCMCLLQIAAATDRSYMGPGD